MEEEDLRPVFEEFGEIFDLAVIRDKISGLHRGARWSDAVAVGPSSNVCGQPALDYSITCPLLIVHSVVRDVYRPCGI